MAKKKKLKDYFELGSISASFLFNNISMVFLVVALILTYIGFAHMAEKNVREIQELQTEIQEIRWNYMAIQSDLMYSTRRAEVAQAVAPLGLRIPRSGPKKVLVKKQNRNGRY